MDFSGPPGEGASLSVTRQGRGPAGPSCLSERLGLRPLGPRAPWGPAGPSPRAPALTPPGPRSVRRLPGRVYLCLCFSIWILQLMKQQRQVTRMATAEPPPCRPPGAAGGRSAHGGRHCPLSSRDTASPARRPPRARFRDLDAQAGVPRMAPRGRQRRPEASRESLVGRGREASQASRTKSRVPPECPAHSHTGVAMDAPQWGVFPLFALAPRKLRVGCGLLLTLRHPRVGF